MIEIRWHGRGGQGAFTASKILGAAAMLDGRQALSFPSFGPERRGAPIQAFTKIDDAKITDRSVVKYCDYIIFLDETLYQETSGADLKENGKILLNTSKREQFQKEQVIAVDADQIAREIIGRAVSNTAMLAVLAVSQKVVSLASLKKAMEFYLPNKVVEKNKQIVNEIMQVFTEEGVSL